MISHTLGYLLSVLRIYFRWGLNYMFLSARTTCFLELSGRNYMSAFRDKYPIIEASLTLG